MIVCVHGYSGNARDFDELARSLSAEARVLCIDVAGRGRSDWLRSPLDYHFPRFLADIDLLLARLKVRKVEWIGTSMGGLLGMLLAARASTPVRRLVMNDVGAYVPLEALQAIARNLEAPESFSSLDKVEAHVRRTHREWGSLTDAQWGHLARHAVRRDGTRYRMHYDPRILQLLRPLPLVPGLFFWDAWYRVRCPVLLLRGERSAILPPDVAHAMRQVKPATELVEIPGCGHVPALMSGAEIEIVRNFLARSGDKAPWPHADSPEGTHEPAPHARAAHRAHRRDPDPGHAAIA